MKEIPETPCKVRIGVPEDLGFMRHMLYEAACWRPGSSRPPQDAVLSDNETAHYVDAWGRPGDTAILALDPTDERKIGAAWYRLMPLEDPGYGFVDAATPEVSVGVVPGRRGLGVGGTLLKALIRAARSQGFKALSLSVETDNPALRIYERHGFVKLFDAGGAWTMKADLTTNQELVPNRSLKLSVLEERMSVCRLDSASEIPDWTMIGGLFSVTRTAEELSVVCLESLVPEGVRCEKSWRVLKLEGPFEFSEVGVLASVTAPLAEAGVPIFAISTFDTDYVLVKEERLDLAVAALRERSYEVL